jgi:glycerate kinase
VKVLIAPDKFRDALDAAEVAAALAAGVRDAQPDAQIALCPLGDGGEGTGRVLAAACGAQERVTTVLDPLGRGREARWWLSADRATGIVEMAEASGLALLAPRERDALRTTSYGTGQLLRAAQDAGAPRVLLCVGGSATVDGGAGCLQALGWRFVDGAGAEIVEPLTGGVLPAIARLESPPNHAALAIDVLCDVDNPLLGPRGAATVYGPQKGATPVGVDLLESGLVHWADVLEQHGGANVRDLPGGGAAGGLPAGLAAALGAHLRPGFAEVARQVGLRDKLAGCDLCLTGEGRIDEQTAGGKVVAGVARLARELGVPAIAFAGAARPDLATTLGVERIIVITPEKTPLPEALAATAANLRSAARTVLGGRA